MTPRALGLLALFALVAIAGCLATPGIGPATEIQFENANAASCLSYGTEPGGGGTGNGNSGVYVADVNGDGWQDLLAVGGREPTLFVNEEGTFERSDTLPAVDGMVKSAHVYDREGVAANRQLRVTPDAVETVREFPQE